MKRIFAFLSIIFILVAYILPTNAYAKTYNVDGIDMTITIDDSIWYVFTRDNIEDNPELDELGLTQEYMDVYFKENDVYLDAILFLDDEGNYIELFVTKAIDGTSVANLSNYDNKTILKWGQEIATEQNIGTASLYETQYKYILFEYKDSVVFYDSEESYDCHINEFYTIINKEQYSIQFQSSSPLTSWEEEEIENIVDSILFDVDESIKEPSNINWASIIKIVLRGALAGAAGGGTVTLLKKKKNNEENEEEKEDINIIE